MIEWALQIVDVLAYLHSQDPPIIFRDLKPANVMVQPDNNIRLIDFGIARKFQPGAVKDTSLLGSVGYLPPEQFGRHQTDTRSDIYALGAMLHHLVTARDPASQPFKFERASDLNPAVPERLSLLLDHCLAMDAKDRPDNVHKVAQELIAIREELKSAPVRAFQAPMQPYSGAVGPASGPHSGPHSGSASGGSGSGPKIISAKLNEAQQHRKRPSGGLPSSTAATNTPRAVPMQAVPTGPGKRIALIAASVLVVACGSLAAVITVSRAHSRHHKGPRSVATNVSTTERPIVPPTTSAPVLSPTVSTDPPTPVADRPVVFNHVGVAGIVQDDHGNALLRIVASGQVTGQVGGEGVIAAFFYDAANNRVMAHDPRPPYANNDGQLSVAHTITLATDPQPFDKVLDIPLSEFPTTQGIKVRCVVFLSNKPTEPSEAIEVPASMLAVGSGPPPVPTDSSSGPLHPGGPDPSSGQPHNGNQDHDRSGSGFHFDVNPDHPH